MTAAGGLDRTEATGTAMLRTASLLGAGVIGPMSSRY